MTDRFIGRDHVTIAIRNIRGYVYADRTGNRILNRWRWEARIGGWHVDTGTAHTRRGAIHKAMSAIDEH